MHTDNRPLETVTASEIADFVFCPESFRLNTMGVPSVSQTERDRGMTHHAHKATAERVAGGSIAVGWWLIIAALLVLGLLCVTF